MGANDEAEPLEFKQVKKVYYILKKFFNELESKKAQLKKEQQPLDKDKDKDKNKNKDPKDIDKNIDKIVEKILTEIKK